MACVLPWLLPPLPSSRCTSSQYGCACLLLILVRHSPYLPEVYKTLRAPANGTIPWVVVGYDKSSTSESWFVNSLLPWECPSSSLKIRPSSINSCEGWIENLLMCLRTSWHLLFNLHRSARSTRRNSVSLSWAPMNCAAWCKYAPLIALLCNLSVLLSFMLLRILWPFLNVACTARCPSVFTRCASIQVSTASPSVADLFEDLQLQSNGEAIKLMVQ